jgi:hypothetical protein
MAAKSGLNQRFSLAAQHDALAATVAANGSHWLAGTS